MRFQSLVVVVSVGVFLFACTEQHDPRRDWQQFQQERAHANADHPKLNDDGTLPKVEGQETVDPITKKYNQLCASCHGANGGGDGPAGGALNPAPRNFITWNESDVPAEWKGKFDEYVAKVIAEGGAAVGKSPTMAPWGSILSAEETTGMVAKVKSFKK